MSEVTPFPTGEQKVTTSTPLSIAEVFEELQQWRRARPIHGQHNIPDPLWEKIFALAKENGASKIRQIFGISAKQFNTKLAEQTNRGRTITPPVSDMTAPLRAPLPPIDLCEALTPASFSESCDPYDEVPIATHTLMVQFRRADGKIMTIHTTTQRIGEIMQSFFNGI